MTTLFTDPIAAAPIFRSTIATAQRILLFSHINPDGDAIGSLLAARHTLRALGKEAIAIASSDIPDYTRRLPGIDDLPIYQRGQALPAADLVWLLDTATLSRVGAIYDDHASTLLSKPLMIVDHHVTNTGEGTLNLIDPRSASNADLLYRLLRAMELPVTPEVATCLLMGVMTDTQSFQTSSTAPITLRVVAELLEAGANHGGVVRDVYYMNPYSTLQLVGKSLAYLQRDGAMAWTIVTREMMEQTGAEDEASDDVVRLMQRVSGVKACAIFKERADGTIKISLRAITGIDVAQVARIWDGGGHTQASGATLKMNLAEAQAAVLPALRAAMEKSQTAR